ncbi:hypothetical protein ABLN87_18640 [Ruegeria sp. SCPT10]|uniref:hypothetical protein n=1 Tax=Ruegeria sp. SCP10 TaxID=3141377 RepID=UPI00333C105B
MRSIDSLNFWSVKRGKDYPAYEPLFDDLQDHVGVLSNDEASKISNYMDFFTDSGGWLSYPVDPLNESRTIEQDGGEDDKYRWSGLLHYLVREYQVDPPLEFRAHVRERLASGQDLQALASDLNAPKQRRNPKMLREREWRKRKADGGVRAAWLLYP